MRRFAARLTVHGLVLALAWLLVPGLTEAAENLLHLVQEGHSAHALDAGSDHAPEGDEHGCSGTFHLCSCHHSSPAATPAAPGAQGLIAAGGLRGLPDPRRADPAPSPPFRPPQA